MEKISDVISILRRSRSELWHRRKSRGENHETLARFLSTRTSPEIKRHVRAFAKTHPSLPPNNLLPFLCPTTCPASRATRFVRTLRTITTLTRRIRQKLPFASMLLLCQHSHYVSANSKPLLYLFRVYDILYFTFFNYFFLFVNIRRAVSLPSAYCQTTLSSFFILYYLPFSTPNFPPVVLTIFLSHNFLSGSRVSFFAGYFELISYSFPSFFFFLLSRGL